jgi:putative phosphoesterase
MSSIAVISDVHGNYPALSATLSDIDSRNVSAIYCLGDLVGYYCMINEVVDEIRSRGITSITGNHDFALVRNNGEIPASRTCTRILKRQIEYITPANLQYIKGLPDQVTFASAGRELTCVHGGLRDHVEEYLYDVDEQYLKSNSFASDVLLAGHTHLPVIRRLGAKTFVNPGSVGQPRDGDPRASYALLSEDGEAQIIRVAYDIDRIAAEMESMGFEKYIYEVLYAGKKIG